MGNLNQVTLIGRVTQEIELRYTARGTAVTSLNLAINRTRKSDNGERQEETAFVEVVLWSKSAELAGQYLSKGREVCICGRLETQEWTDKQTGQKRSKLRVVGENMQFIGGGGDKQSHPGHASNPGSSQMPPSEPVDDEDEPIPF